MMKIFSMIFTVLVFFGFTSTTYADVYSVTNKAGNVEVTIFLADVGVDKTGRVTHITKPSRANYIAETGTCLYVRSSDFYRLWIGVSVRDNSTFGGSLCEPPISRRRQCQAANSDIIYSPLARRLPYRVTNAISFNRSPNCIDIESWMEIQEQEYFNDIESWMEIQEQEYFNNN